MWRLFGSILLIIGTCIGAGILALPIITAAGGFYYSCVLLIICWFISTCAAFYLLEVNLHFPANSNIISMAKQTLGAPGQILAWIIYLLLLYSLLAAYLAGGSDIIGEFNSLLHLHLPAAINTILFLIILGAIVFRGVRAVDWTNRGLMLTKLAVFFLVCGLSVHHVSSAKINAHLSLSGELSAIMIVITAFGFSIIIPSLRVYLKSNVLHLRLAVLISSLVALFCYLFWIFAVQGNLSQTSLALMANSSHTVSDLTDALSHQLNHPILTSLIHLFTTICILTSFLGVALSLSDFLSDGLQIKKQGHGNWILFLATFLPPLIITLLMPSVFINALKYAGIFCILLLILMPTWMAFRIRQRSSTSHYQVIGGNKLIFTVLIVSLLLLIVGCFYF